MNQAPIVNVTEGSLLGTTNFSPNGISYYSFTGIPYAQPPIGPLRFKDPLPHGPWTGVRDATKIGNVSAQVDAAYPFKYSGDDDSLFLNVFTPKLSPSILLPVMIYIHGGAYAMGTSTVFQPGYLIEKDVIVASMNYRLGVMGFLCTDPVNARGDMGLKDQNLALKWLKNNIKYFGGDPGNMTIFGDSAGSASVEYHVLSDMSKGLFSKAIMESGSAMSFWARRTDPFNISRRLADKLGYNESKGSVFGFLNSFETEKLVRATRGLENMDDLKRAQILAFVPAINVFKDNKGFINEEPVEILKNGKFNKVPTITGFCNDEGLFMKYFYEDDKVWNDMKNRKFLDYVPNSLNKNFTGGQKRLDKIYPPNNDSKNKFGSVYDFIADLNILAGAFYSFSQRMKHTNNLYMYNFAYDGKLKKHPEIYSKDGDRLHGVSHVEELSYLSSVLNTTNADDLTMRNRLVGMWTDFAKTGNPTPGNSNVKWLPTTKEKFQYMQLDLDFKMESKLEDREKLWEELYSTL